MLSIYHVATKWRSTILLGILLVLVASPIAYAAQGQLISETVHAASLEGNLVGDSPDRLVIFYLPPSYETSPEKRYPVLYLLHGFTGSPESWTGNSYDGFNIQKTMDMLIEYGWAQEMIIVMPDAHNVYQGSWYVDSPATGNWETFITQELIQYVDTHYRTIPDRRSRGIAGHSMGGWGISARHEASRAVQRPLPHECRAHGRGFDAADRGSKCRLSIRWSRLGRGVEADDDGGTEFRGRERLLQRLDLRGIRAQS